jgi:DNA polymerase III subunit beta
MKASFLLENLIPILPLLNKVSPSHSQIPILSSILLEVAQGEISFSATDLEFGVNYKIQGKTEEEGGVLVPGKQLVELMSGLGRGKVLLTQEKDRLVIEAENGEFKFQVLPKEEFPKLYEEKGEKIEEFTPKTFPEIFEKLTFAVSQDESRPHLTGVYVVEKAGDLDCVATDGFRLSLKKIKTKETSGRLREGLIIPPRLIMEMMGVKSQEDISLYVYDRGNQAIFETGKTILVGRLIEGQYPDYEKVIPKSTVTSIKLDREEFTRILKTLSVFARESANVVNINLSNGIATFKVGASSLGDAEVKMEGAQTGEDNNISFNIRFVVDFLRTMGGKYVTMKINSPQEPALFAGDEDPNFMHVIMPVRVEV